MKDRSALPDTDDPSVSPASESAGGIQAVVASMRMAQAEMGIVRSAKTLLAVNQRDGFDCPGCAWPDPDHERSLFEFCENGAKAVAEEATLARATPEFFGCHSIADLRARSDHWLGKQGRLTEPMIVRRSESGPNDATSFYQRISWDEAFALIANELRALKSPNEAIFYTSGRTSNEAAFVYQLFVREFGTNNLPDCSNMCHESSGTALSEVIGVGKGTVRLDDFNVADLILIVGQNPGTNHPRMLTTLDAARKRGCTIVSINPLFEAGLKWFQHPQDPTAILSRGTELATMHVPVRINGDVALFQGLAKELLEAEEAAGGVLDRAFIDEYTTGFDAFQTSIARASWGDLVESSGIDRAQIRNLARLLMDAKRTIVCWAMGLTQHKNAVANIQEIVNVLLLQGNIGRPGAGVCPVRGHSNVQGDRTMGIWERMPEAFLDRIQDVYGFEPPRKHGFDTVAAIEAMLKGEGRVFFAMGGNFLSAAPDTQQTEKALRRTRLTVHVSTKLNRSHLTPGEMGIILPCLGRTERDVQASGEQVVTVENSMAFVHTSRGSLAPASEKLKSEVNIVAGLAIATLGERSRVPWVEYATDYGKIREAIEQVVPGFEDFNARVGAGGFYLPSTARERVFATRTGRAIFTVHRPARHDLAPGQLLMMTIRSHDQYNTTVYGLDDRYRGIHGGRRVVFLNADDIAELGLKAGEQVDLVSHFTDGERMAKGFKVVAYAIPRRCAATYFPEANALVPLGNYADGSRTPVSKSVVISLRKS